MSVILKEIKRENIGDQLTFSETPTEKVEGLIIIGFIRDKIKEAMSTNYKDERCRIFKEIFDYIIDRDIFKNPKLNYCIKFRATVWNKLVEIQHTNIPGPNNPIVWVPVVGEKLSFLNNICHSTGKTSFTEWNAIP